MENMFGAVNVVSLWIYSKALCGLTVFVAYIYWTCADVTGPFLLEYLLLLEYCGAL